jgi:uncharacterized coiled-coil DUF342 family protein
MANKTQLAKENDDLFEALGMLVQVAERQQKQMDDLRSAVAVAVKERDQYRNRALALVRQIKKRVADAVENVMWFDDIITRAQIEELRHERDTLRAALRDGTNEWIDKFVSPPQVEKLTRDLDALRADYAVLMEERNQYRNHDFVMRNNFDELLKERDGLRDELDSVKRAAHETTK